MAVIIQVNSRALDFLPIFSLLRINIDVIRVTTPKMYGKYRASTIEVLNNIVVKLIGSLLYRESLIYIYISNRVKFQAILSKIYCKNKVLK